jgi:hypothetical protein
MLGVPSQDCVELRSYPNFSLHMVCVENMALMLHGKNQGFRGEMCSTWLPLDTWWRSCPSTQMRPLIISKHVGGRLPMCLLCIEDYCPFWGPFSQKACFFKKGIFKWIFLKYFIYCIYSCPNMSYVFLQSNLEKYKFLKVHRFCQILCFILKKFHNFKSYENMLKFSSLIVYIISYKIF